MVRDWRQVVADAALAAGVAEEAARLVALLEAVASDAGGDAPAAAELLRTVLAALDAAARSRRSTWDAAELVAARAALRAFPRLIKQLELGASATALASQLAALAAAATGPADDGTPTAAGWRCPRCGSHRIDEQHTDGTGLGRFVELLCGACSLYG